MPPETGDRTPGQAGSAPLPTRCGFVALVGAPNAGKSTLVNAMVGAKVSIVTPKVQTTRTRVLGIALLETAAFTAQLVLVDTPGIFAPKRRLDRAMVAAAWQGAEDADLVAVVVDAARQRRDIDPDTRRIVEGLAASGRRAMLVLNKVDLLPRPELLPVAERLTATGVFDEVFMVSATTGDGVADLLDRFAAGLPEGPFLFPGDQLSDMNDRMLAAEVTREQLFLQLRQELPYALTVETETWEERRDGGVRIEQTIYVERPNHRAMVLGAQGRRLKSIGAAARQELAALLDRPVHLFLFVKQRAGWQDDPERYRPWGLDFDA